MMKRKKENKRLDGRKMRIHGNGPALHTNTAAEIKNKK